jgi:hypothetical protein
MKKEFLMNKQFCTKQVGVGYRWKPHKNQREGSKNEDDRLKKVKGSLNKILNWSAIFLFKLAFHYHVHFGIHLELIYFWSTYFFHRVKNRQSLLLMKMLTTTTKPFCPNSQAHENAKCENFSIALSNLQVNWTNV